MKGYGALLERARVAAGLTQIDVARHLGKESKTPIVRFEDERQEPTIDEVNRLAEILPVSVPQLLEAMGARISLRGGERLPPVLLEELRALSPEELAALTMLLIRGREVKRQAGALER